MDIKVFWSVLAALAVAGLAVLGYQRYQEARAWQAMNDFAESQAQQLDEANAKVRLERAVWEQQQVQRRAAALDAGRPRLAENQQCVGGTVVTVNGSTYVQAVAADGRPEACEGRIRVLAR